MPKDTFFNLPLQKQEKVIRVTIHEFLNQGYEKGNIGNIAKNAEVSKGSMYQYFENKKELFLYSVRWSIELLVKKYDQYMNVEKMETDIFTFFYQNAKEIWLQMRDEREVTIFIQNVFLGKYNTTLTDESMAYMIKASDEYLLNLIKDGKRKGSIRTDIDDHILSLFMTGVTYKIKEYLMRKARDLGEDIIDEDYESNKKEVMAMIELLKNGMGAK